MDFKAALDTVLSLKALPLWIFLALAVSGFACLFAPDIGDIGLRAFRAEYGKWFWLDAVTMSVFTFFSALNLSARYVSHLIGRRRRRNKRISAFRFYKVYAPAYAALHGFYTTETSFVEARYFRQRFRNALSDLKMKDAYYGRFTFYSRLRQAWKSLFDKRVTKHGAENEYGDVWPLEKIGRILDKSLLLCDPVLLDLYATADRNRIDQSPHPSVLLPSDTKLRNYITAQYDQLKTRMGM